MADDIKLWCSKPPCGAYEPFYFKTRLSSALQAGFYVYGDVLPDSKSGFGIGSREIILISFNVTGDNAHPGFQPITEVEDRNYIGFVRMMGEDESITIHGGMAEDADKQVVRP